MKLFIVFNYQCYNDVTDLYRNIEDARNHYDKETIVVEAPDYVFVGWGFDSSKSGDERFIKPETPDGWLYDDDNGTFYPDYSNSEKRRLCYSSGFVVKEDVDFRVEWNNEVYTIDDLEILGMKYEFRGDKETSDKIKEVVKKAVLEIREKYPD